MQLILVIACMLTLRVLLVTSTVKVVLLEVLIVLGLLPSSCSKHFSSNRGVNFLLSLSFILQSKWVFNCFFRLSMN